MSDIGKCNICYFEVLIILCFIMDNLMTDLSEIQGKYKIRQQYVQFVQSVHE